MKYIVIFTLIINSTACAMHKRHHTPENLEQLAAVAELTKQTESTETKKPKTPPSPAKKLSQLDVLAQELAKRALDRNRTVSRSADRDKKSAKRFTWRP